MKKAASILLTSILLYSCTINLYRPHDPSAVDLNAAEQSFLSFVGPLSDTILTLRKSDCQINSRDYFIAIYKLKGQTKSQAFSNFGNYPIEPTLSDFNWTRIYSAVDSIKTQSPVPSYLALVVEGDTSWYPGFNYVSDVWTFTLYSKADTLSWESFSEERQANPSMAKTKISNYILAETANKVWGMPGLYGEQKTKKLPILSRR